MNNKVNLEHYDNWLSTRNKMGRALWIIVCKLLYKPLALSVFWPWRRFLLKLFGAKIGKQSYVYADVKIWAPWNLELGWKSCLGPAVNVYNTGRIVIGSQVTISHGAYLCPGSHDITHPHFPMICSDMFIGDLAWVATEAFVGGMGVHIGEGAVVGARAVVTKDVAPWTVVAGNPAKYIKDRVIRTENKRDE